MSCTILVCAKCVNCLHIVSNSVNLQFETCVAAKDNNNVLLCYQQQHPTAAAALYSSESNWKDRIVGLCRARPALHILLLQEFHLVQEIKMIFNIKICTNDLIIVKSLSWTGLDNSVIINHFYYNENSEFPTESMESI